MENQPKYLMAVFAGVFVLLLLIYFAINEVSKEEEIQMSSITSQQIEIDNFNNTCINTEIDEQYCNCIYNEFAYIPEEIEQLSTKDFEDELYRSIRACRSN